MNWNVCPKPVVQVAEDQKAAEELVRRIAAIRLAVEGLHGDEVYLSHGKQVAAADKAISAVDAALAAFCEEVGHLQVVPDDLDTSYDLDYSAGERHWRCGICGKRLCHAE
jgi:hypothetical protein